MNYTVAELNDTTGHDPSLVGFGVRFRVVDAAPKREEVLTCPI
jgi:hypothetical protein